VYKWEAYWDVRIIGTCVTHTHTLQRLEWRVLVCSEIRNCASITAPCLAVQIDSRVQETCKLRCPCCSRIRSVIAVAAAQWTLCSDRWAMSGNMRLWKSAERWPRWMQRFAKTRGMLLLRLAFRFITLYRMRNGFMVVKLRNVGNKGYGLIPHKQAC
jgi:hypothetical protein